MKKRSRFVQQQKYNRHLQNKSSSNMNHTINKSNRQIEKYRKDYDDSVKEIVKDFIIQNDLDPDKIPNNSRIIIFELLRKNIQNKLDSFTDYIDKHKDRDLREYYDAKAVCVDVLEQIDWIYDWTRPLKDEKYEAGDEENNETILNSAKTKLESTEKKIESLEALLSTLNETENVYKSDILYYFYRFCNFIIMNDVDKYYIYISNTIKNLLILDSEDPIVDFLVKDFKEDVDNIIEYGND